MIWILLALGFVDLFIGTYKSNEHMVTRANTVFVGAIVLIAIENLVI